MATRSPSRRVERPAHDVATSRPAFWGNLFRAALATRPARDPASIVRAGGWLVRLLLRLAIIAVILLAMLAVAVYVVARSL